MLHKLLKSLAKKHRESYGCYDDSVVDEDMLRRLRGNTIDVPYYKVAIVGGGNVGKSALIKRLIFDEFANDYIPTVSEMYETAIKNKDTGAIMMIYDTAGSIEFPVMLELTISKCDACIVVYSVDSLTSLKEAERKIRIISEVKGKDFPCVLVGNKTDIPKHCREVTFEQALQCAVKHGYSYIETSSRENINVLEAFEAVIRKINSYERFKRKILRDKKKIEKTLSNGKYRSSSSSLSNGKDRSSSSSL